MRCPWCFNLQLFSPVVRESLKQMSCCSFQYFLSPRSCYPVPEGMQTINQLPPVPRPRKETLPASDLELLQEWRVQHGQAVRQLTVGQLLTKDKPATLPISAYQKPPPEPQIVDVHGMLGSDTERMHMPGDEVQDPTATPAIIYPVHSFVVTTAPVSETSSFCLSIFFLFIAFHLQECILEMHNTVYLCSAPVLEAKSSGTTIL